ncbi:MAG TPA: dethiobiotin synthase [Casimicrobiaceae bacterium]
MRPTRSVFVTGTDTGVGKTYVAQALLRAHVAAGRRAVGMKPVAAGIADGAAVNADVAALAAAGNVEAPLADRNPYAFAPAVAPHLAAAAAGVAIDLEKIEAAFGRLAARADIVVVEGAGGLLVPLGATSDMLDIASRLGLPVLLVVGMRLGCLNHALLSDQALRARGVKLAGWVANVVDSGMPMRDANVAALVQRLAAPCVAVAEHGGAVLFTDQWLGGGEPC